MKQAATLKDLLHPALWRKCWSEAWPLCLGCGLILFAFDVVFVWMTSLFKSDALLTMLALLPSPLQRLSGLPLETVASPTGRLALVYIDPIIVFAASIWAIARGSDIVSGEIGRGTMEMILAQPVRRWAVFGIHAAVSLIGSLMLALAALAGNYVGLMLVTLEGANARSLWPAAANLFGLMVFLCGASGLVSSWGSVRSRTIGVMGGFFAVQMIIKVIGRVAPGYDWLFYGTFFGAYEPQVLATMPSGMLPKLLLYDGILCGLGLTCYLVGCVIFCRRDLPAPL